MRYGSSALREDIFIHEGMLETIINVNCIKIRSVELISVIRIYSAEFVAMK